MSRNGSESFWRHITAISHMSNGHPHNHKHIYAISLGEGNGTFFFTNAFNSDSQLHPFSSPRSPSKEWLPTLYSHF